MATMGNVIELTGEAANSWYRGGADNEQVRAA